MNESSHNDGKDITIQDKWVCESVWSFGGEYPGACILAPFQGDSI